MRVCNTDKITNRFDGCFRLCEEFLKIDGGNSFVLQKLLSSGDSSPPDVANGYRMIVHPIPKRFFYRHITPAEETPFPFPLLR